MKPRQYRVRWRYHGRFTSRELPLPVIGLHLVFPMDYLITRFDYCHMWQVKVRAMIHKKNNNNLAKRLIIQTSHIFGRSRNPTTIKMIIKISHVTCTREEMIFAINENWCLLHKNLVESRLSKRVTATRPNLINRTWICQFRHIF